MIMPYVPKHKNSPKITRTLIIFIENGIICNQLIVPLKTVNT